MIQSFYLRLRETGLVADFLNVLLSELNSWSLQTGLVYQSNKYKYKYHLELPISKFGGEVYVLLFHEKFIDTVLCPIFGNAPVILQRVCTNAWALASTAALKIQNTALRSSQRLNLEIKRLEIGFRFWDGVVQFNCCYWGARGIHFPRLTVYRRRTFA